MENALKLISHLITKNVNWNDLMVALFGTKIKTQPKSLDNNESHIVQKWTIQM